MRGSVKFYAEAKGFGFVAADDGQEYFVPQASLDRAGIATLKRAQSLAIGQSAPP